MNKHTDSVELYIILEQVFNFSLIIQQRTSFQEFKVLISGWYTYSKEFPPEYQC